MKKNVLQKIVTTSMVCVSLGNPVIALATSQSVQEMVSVSNKVLEEFPIKNGDFNNGLEHWIVSSPGTNNPALITEGENHYVKATHGENIHQYLTLKPNKTYKFSYDVAGSANFPAKIEFGTLNHDEGFVSLQESMHANEKWERKHFTFSTPDSNNTYIIRFSSTGDGWATFDNIQVYMEDTEAPTIPENLRASDITESSVKLEWDASTDNVGVTGYQIFRDGEKIETVSGQTLTFTDKGLKENTEYKYTVRAMDASNNISEDSNEETVLTKKSTDTEAPTAPKNLTASDITENSVQLDWEASTDNVGVTGYRIYRNNSPYTFVKSGTSYINKGLKPGTKYSYKVVALDAAGNVSEESNIVDITTKEAEPVDTEAPTAPRDAVGRVLEGNVLSVWWNYAQDNVGVAGYIIYRDGKEVGQTSYQQLAYVDQDMPAGKEYIYTIKAFDAAGNISEPSEEVKLKTEASLDHEAPTTPTNLRATLITNKSVTLNWNASKDNASSFHYRIYRDGKLLVTLNETFTGYVDNDVKESTKYSYTVEAVDNVGNVSKMSNSLSVTTKEAPDTEAPTAPKNLKATDITKTSAKLTWEAATDNKGISAYRIFRNGQHIFTVNGTTQTYTDTELKENTTYKYTVKAVDTSGNLSVDSNTLSVTTQRYSPIDTVSWVSKPDGTKTIKPGGDIAFSSWYKDKFGRREIDLILTKDNKRLDMTKYDVISSNTNAIGNSTTSTEYKKKGHINLPMVKPGTSKISIRDRSTGEIYEVATLYHSYL